MYFQNIFIKENWPCISCI